MNDWFEDSEFWRIFGDCMFDEARFRAAEEEIPALLQLADIAVSHVLDLGCGPGRHCVPLAAAGLSVTAVDRTAAFLETARERADQRGVTLEFQQADMREFSRPESFQLVINMWTSFGYFQSVDDDLLVLQRCLQNLHPGGVLLIDTAGKEIVCRDIEPVMATELQDGALLVERPTLTDDMTRYSNQWHLLRDGQAHTAEWHHNLYSGQEMRALLEQAGFCDIRLYGSLDGDPYDLDAQRMVVLGQRP